MVQQIDRNYDDDDEILSIFILLLLHPLMAHLVIIQTHSEPVSRR